MAKISAVAEVEWTEYERGWGQRSDGFSYHRSIAEANEYIDAYWKKQPRETPDCYRSPGKAKLVQVNAVFEFLVEGKGIMWSYKSCKI